MNICQGMIEGSRIFPDKCAIWFEGKEVSYAELESLSARAAKVLADHGVNRGDRVALILGNVPAFPVWYYGILRLGAIAVSVNTRLTEEEAGFIVSDCEANVVIRVGSETATDDAFPGCRVLDVAEDGTISSPSEDRIGVGEFVEMEPRDPGIILYTSGTTGFPKGATLSHRNVRATVHAFNHLCGMDPNDRLLLMVPLFHCYGQNAILNSGLNVGATIVLQRVFDLGESKQLIMEQGITKLFGVPTTFQLMLDACEPEDIMSIAYCFSAAATLAPQLGQSWQEKFGMPIYEGYGLTETAPFASYNHPLKHVPGSIGVPVDLAEMKVVDPETGETCAPGVPGEIAVRGPNVMLGYWNRSEETAEAVRDGWFYSGDVGKVDENGYFFIVDRIKDMIAIGGLKVFPSEVERVLLDAPGVADCAVVGLPEPTLGEEVAVFVVSSDQVEPDPESLRAFALEHLAKYKVPSRVIYLDELPRNPAGKVLKIELRNYSSGEDTMNEDGPAENDPNLLMNRLIAAHASARERLLTEHLQETIRGLTAAEEVPPVDMALLETGMDSLMMVNLVNHLKSELDSRLDLPATLVFDYPKIRDLSGYLLDALELSPASAADSGSKSAPLTEVESVSTEPSKDIDEMSEEEALSALQKELEE